MTIICSVRKGLCLHQPPIQIGMLLSQIPGDHRSAWSHGSILHALMFLSLSMKIGVEHLPCARFGGYNAEVICSLLLKDLQAGLRIQMGRLA